MAFKGKLLQYLVFSAGSFSKLQSGMHLGWPSPSLPQLLSNSSAIKVTNDEGSSIASMLLFGSICGAIISVPTLDWVGRKIMLLSSCLPFFASWLLIAFAQTTWELYIARLLAGTSVGIVFSCLPIYLAEICDPKIRGFLISATLVVYLLGAFMVNLLGTYFSITEVALTSAVLSLMTVLLYSLVPESPQFYIIRKKMNQAKISMTRFTGKDNVDVSLNLIENSVIEQEAHKRKWWQLFTDTNNCKTLGLVAALKTFQQFSGFLGITFYTQTLFEESYKDVRPIVFVSVYYLLQTAGSTVNAAIIDRAGRRPLLLASMSLTVVGLFFVTAYFGLQNLTQVNVDNYSWLPILGLFVFIIGYTLGLQNIPIVLGGEIFPLDFKAYANGIINFVYGITGAGLSKYFQYTKDAFGTFVPFLSFTICSICGLIFIFFFVPETKRKTLEEIQNQFRSKRLSSRLNNR